MAGDFAKVTGIGGSSVAVLTLGVDALSRWVPQDGAASKSFTAGSYQVQTGSYQLRLTDSADTATLTVT